MRFTAFYAAVAAAMIAVPAHAQPPQISTSYNPTVGLGVTFAFDGGGKMETGIGLRVFSSNQRNKAAATVGLDYMFSSKRLRPSLGTAYIGSDAYIGADVGFGLNGEGFDFGLGLGAVNTKKVLALPPV